MTERQPIDLTPFNKIYLLKGLSPQELRYIAGIVIKREYTPAQTIFKKGDRAASIFIVEKGSVNVIKNETGSNPLILTTLKEGTLFGEIPFVTQSTRTADVIAAEKTSVLEFNYSELERLANLNLGFGLKLYKAISSHLAMNVIRMTEMTKNTPAVTQDQTKTQIDIPKAEISITPSSDQELVIEIMDHPALRNPNK